jgi:ketosteroid isomerase-like protein
MKIKVRSIFLYCIFFQVLNIHAQDVSNLILSINARMDQAVVDKDLPFLQQHYAEDFVFTHGTGYVEGKASWLRDVADPKTTFISRVQDSTTVELHADVGIVRGKVEITRLDNNREIRYGIWYIRVYQLRDQRWQMISHFTFREWHHP